MREQAATEGDKEEYEGACDPQVPKRPMDGSIRKTCTEQANLTKERIEILDSLGFVWEYHNILWEQSYGQLKHFQRVYGHTRLPLKFKKGQLVNQLKTTQEAANSTA